MLILLSMSFDVENIIDPHLEMESDNLGSCEEIIIINMMHAIH